MDVQRQILSGKLVCPRTGVSLILSEDGTGLQAANEGPRYRLHAGRIPVLLVDESLTQRYLAEADRALLRVGLGEDPADRGVAARLRARQPDDHRSQASRMAFRSIFDNLTDESLCLSVGGGPSRSDPRLTNVNIGPFPNVDVVGDVHRLPYADACVDAIHCEAVLEHLPDPPRAVREMHRVLKPGRKAFFSAPFLFPYHGHPHHYQNFTLTGLQHLAVTAGFRILDAGTAVGPVYTMIKLVSTFLEEYLPSRLGRPLRFLWDMAGGLVWPLDRNLNHRQSARVLATITYILATR